jgi:hypothetical protein
MGVFTDNITIILYYPKSSWFQNYINDACAELNNWFMLVTGQSSRNFVDNSRVVL